MAFTGSLKPPRPPCCQNLRSLLSSYFNPSAALDTAITSSIFKHFLNFTAKYHALLTATSPGPSAVVLSSYCSRPQSPWFSQLLAPRISPPLAFIVTFMGQFPNVSPGPTSPPESD